MFVREAMTNTRSRRCGAPTAAAGMQSHCALYPSEARSARTCPNPRERWPATFSNNANRGLTTRRHSANIGQRWRSSFCPRRTPARLNGWQGYPPQTRSTVGTVRQSMSLMSPRFGVAGQCFLSTREPYGLISDCHRQVMPARSSPRSRPPMPEKSDPKFMCRTRIARSGAHRV